MRLLHCLAYYTPSPLLVVGGGRRLSQQLLEKERGKLTGPLGKETSALPFSRKAAMRKFKVKLSEQREESVWAVAGATVWKPR